MRTIERTAKGVVIEITYLEIKEKGFDIIWDEIREIFSEEKYTIVGSKEKSDNKIHLIYLEKINPPRQISDIIR